MASQEYIDQEEIKKKKNITPSRIRDSARAQQKKEF